LEAAVRGGTLTPALAASEIVGLLGLPATNGEGA
jgi:hypothetical protein